MADFLADKLREIDDRLKELRPLHDEYLKLERAKQALEGMDAPRRRGPGRPRGSGATAARTSAASGNGRRRRRRRGGGGTAADKVLDVVRQNPGITVTEVGDQLGYTQKNYLYRVFHNLTEDGAVQKQGKGYTAV
jgi:AraC-like DNA-binding protein